MSEYEPIQCGLHDIIEDRIVRRVECSVVYRVQGGEATRSYSGKLADVYSRDGAEFVVLAAGESVRLDRVLKVDEVDFID